MSQQEAEEGGAVSFLQKLLIATLAAEAAAEQVGATEYAGISEAGLQAGGEGRGTQEEVEGEWVAGTGGGASGGAEGSGEAVGSLMT